VRIETWTDDRGGRWTVAVAETRPERRRGVLGLDALQAGTGLFLPRCRSVHTVGLAFAIDVVALDPSLTVLRVVTCGPGRLVVPRRRVRDVLELPARSGVRVGDRFVVDDHSSPTSTASPELRSTTVRGWSSGIAARTSSAARRR
jgi:uncharacterized membrane protein (UPF0127 family)